VSQTKIEINKNIAVPETGWKGAALPNYPKAGEYPWSRMSVGDSFFIALPEGGDIVRLMNRITGAGASKVGAGCITARCVEENDQIGVRVWKIAEPDMGDD
jgi:hypothetical protein